MSGSGIDDYQRAARVLLARPLVRSTDGDTFRLVKRNAPALRDWFEINTGWGLHVDTAIVRLAREPAVIDDPTHPLVTKTAGVAFSRRRYVLLMLCLTVLERSDSQISLGRLAEQVLVFGATPELTAAGFSFSLATREDRSDLVASVQALLEWGALARVAGDESDYVRHSGDVLYDVSRRVLSQLLVSRRGASVVGGESLDERLTALRDRGLPPSDDMRNLQLRQRLTRRLLDDPVVYNDELSDDELAYLRSQRAAICRRITELTGLVAEIRAEGLAMIDLDDDLTDLRMPEKGTDGHVALILAEFLTGSDSTEVSTEALESHLLSVSDEYRSFWRNDATDPGAQSGLVRIAVARLVALRLARRTQTGIRVLPALARFAVGSPTIAGDPRS